MFTMNPIWVPNVPNPYGYIYVTYNVTENKYYCGKHKSSVFDTKYYGSGTLLKKALSNQPITDFVCIPIDWAESAEELHAKEVQWIREFNAVDSNEWYNLIEDSNEYLSSHKKVKRKIIPKVCYFDADTGEQITPTQEELKQVNNKFFKGFNSGLINLAQKNISKSAYRVALFILATMGYQNNFTYQCKNVAIKLNLQTAAISASMKELIKIRFLVPIPDSIQKYLVNPEFGFRGSNLTPTQKWFYKLYYDYTQQQEEKFFNESEEFFKQQKKAEAENSTSTSPNYSSDNIKSSKKKKSNGSLKQTLSQSKKLGLDRKNQLLTYLQDNCDENNLVHKRVKDIVEETHISKTTVISFLSYLVETNLIQRIDLKTIKLL